jgi:hypothetical protein
LPGYRHREYPDHEVNPIGGQLVVKPVIRAFPDAVLARASNPLGTLGCASFTRSPGRPIVLKRRLRSPFEWALALGARLAYTVGFTGH